MKKINEVLARRTEYVQPTQNGIMSDRLIETFWLRMTEIYGHKWISSYGETDQDGTWSKCLADLTGAQLKNGFKTCMTNGESWPPSLPQFRAFCKPPQRPNEAMYRIPHERRLEKQLSDEHRTTARLHIAELKRKALGNVG